MGLFKGKTEAVTLPDAQKAWDEGDPFFLFEAGSSFSSATSRGVVKTLGGYRRNRLAFGACVVLLFRHAGKSSSRSVLIPSTIGG